MRLYFLFAKIKTILGRILKRKYFEMKTDIDYKAYSDTDYDSHYNQIF